MDRVIKSINLMFARKQIVSKDQHFQKLSKKGKYKRIQYEYGLFSSQEVCVFS